MPKKGMSSRFSVVSLSLKTLLTYCILVQKFSTYYAEICFDSASVSWHSITSSTREWHLKRNKNLKIDGAPVDIMFARQQNRGAFKFFL